MATPNKHNFKSRSIRTHVLAPICFLVVLELTLVLCGFMMTGLPGQLDAMSEYLLEKTVTTRADYLQRSMTERWSNLGTTVQDLRVLYEATGTDAATLASDTDTYTAFLIEAFPVLRSLMRTNKVTGAYVMLCGGFGDPDTAANYPALYLRDRDPVSHYTDADTDLLLEIAPMGVASATHISTDSYWRPMVQVTPSNASDAAFCRAYQNALQYPTYTYTDLACWTAPYIVGDDNRQVISYSVPLVDANGIPFGVLGIDITLDHLISRLPTSDFTASRSCYALAVWGEDGSFTPVATTTGEHQLADAIWSGLAKLPPQENISTILHPQTADALPMAAWATPLSLYNSNAPCSGSQWVLYGLEPEESLFSMSTSVTMTVYSVTLASVAICLIAAIVIARSLTRPIARLEKEVRASERANAPAALTHTGITELDSLSEAMQSMNAEVIRVSGKLTGILSLSSINLGAFELDTKKRTMFYTAQFFKVFGRPELQPQTQSYDDFVRCLHDFDCYLLDSSRLMTQTHGEGVYEIVNDDATLWVRLKVNIDGALFTGLAEDVTHEWQAIRTLEYERNHDPLTGIFNRRAFFEHYKELFDTNALQGGYGALVMLDLDNLKYVNDTYGHDSGDCYIRAAANALQQSVGTNSLAARISGDEFLVFLYSDSETHLRSCIELLRENLRSKNVVMSDGSALPLRASAGVAWYPRDSTDPDLLKRYADFAMYVGKHSEKGGTVDFDKHLYHDEAYLLQGKEALNQLIEKKLVDYYFQPIVDARSGAVFGYEMLMRPRVASLSNPSDVLTLARQDSRLGAIEQLTWFCAMEAFVKYYTAGALPQGCKVFINSVSNQCLPPAAVADFERLYAPWLPQIVQEHTEGDAFIPEVFEKKCTILRSWKAQQALDDFGSGYNSENVLLQTSPHYVKLDMGIVRGVDTDKSRQQLISSLVQYAHGHGISVIAEGVESAAEMQTLQTLEVDYFQGYYFARPMLPPPLPNPQALRTLKANAQHNQKTD